MSDPSALSLEGLLSELNASLSQPSGEAAMRRINAERLVHLLTEDFIATHRADRIRIIPDRRLVGEPGADLLLQVDDYDIRLRLLDAPENLPVLDVSELIQLSSLLEDNPSTVALILVWTTSDLRSVSLKTSDIKHLREDHSQLLQLLSSARPLPEVLGEIVTRQAKMWQPILDPAPRAGTAPADLKSLFKAAFDKAVEAERQRSYKYPARIEAARRFPLELENRLILDTLIEALGGETSESLERRLARIQPGG
jgi:hypothetical protein